MLNINWDTREHVVLSNNAASHYDDDYAMDNYQTRQYMQYEETLLMQATSLVTDKQLAIELGCGTGRDLFKYSDQFTKAIGWDFSPEMVLVAREKALKYGHKNVYIEERDVEKDYFSGIEAESVNFMNAGFGMGSFIQNLDTFLLNSNKAMAKDGIFMATFYNKNTIQRITNHKCFAAIPDINKNTLAVVMEGKTYEIPCISYSVEELHSIIGKYFEVVKILTYPTISTLLTDNVLYETEVAILELEKAVEQCLWGHYIVVWCKKH